MATQVKTRPAKDAGARSTGGGKAGAGARLSPEQLVEVLELLRGATSVELKLMVSDSQRGVIRRLGFDPVEAQPRQVYFFDTPDLQLNKAGVIVAGMRCFLGASSPRMCVQLELAGAAVDDRRPVIAAAYPAEDRGWQRPRATRTSTR